jgi:hypothetical protein
MRLPLLIVLGLTTASLGNAACAEVTSVDRTKIPDELFDRPTSGAGGAASGGSGGTAGGGAADADAGADEDAGG